MDPRLIAALDGVGLGTGVAIIIAVVVFGYGLYKVYKKFSEDIAQRAQNQVIAEEASENLKKSIDSITSSLVELDSKITSVNSKVTDFDEKYTESIEDIKDEITAITEKLESSKMESNNADAVLENKLTEYNKNIEKLSGALTNLEAQTNRLVESDRDSIKAYIVGVHKSATNEGYIDLHTLSIVESQYITYLSENGNSFVEKLMTEIRDLPEEPPKKKRATTTRKKKTKEE